MDNMKTRQKHVMSLTDGSSSVVKKDTFPYGLGGGISIFVNEGCPGLSIALLRGVKVYFSALSLSTLVP